MTLEELKREEERIKEEREYANVRQVVTTMRCPLCGSILKGWVDWPKGDTLDSRAHIECSDGCHFFRAQGKWFSMYDKGASKALALQCLIDVVRPYIKVFGSPLEDKY